MRVRIDSRKFVRHVDKISQIIRVSTNISTYRNFVIFNLFIGEIPYIVTYCEYYSQFRMGLSLR